MNKKSITTLLVLSVLLATSQIHASTIPDITLCKAEDNPTRYKKRFYNHWIDEDENGLDTRAEVLRKEVVSSVILEEKRGRKKLQLVHGMTITLVLTLKIPTKLI